MSRQHRRVLPLATMAAALVASLGASLSEAQLSPESAPHDIAPLVAEYCEACHGSLTQTAGLDLSTLVGQRPLVKNREIWNRVIDVLEEGRMPPARAPQPPADIREQMVLALHRDIDEFDYSTIDDPGFELMRRLTHAEYDNTLRDLFGVALHVTDRFPSELTGSSGFDNSANTLFLQPSLMERYIAVAERVVELALPADPTSDVHRASHDLIFVSAPDNRTSEAEATDTWLTGRDYNSRLVNAGGISADQLAAAHLRDETLLPSLELAVKGEGYFSNSLPRNAISWSAADRPMTREIEPRAIFDRMFRPPLGGATNRSVMDAVLADARALAGYVSAADRSRLDEYFESIRALERRIEFAESRSADMRDDGALTDTLMTPTPGIPADHQSYLRLMMDLMVAAFQSDATRVCTFMLDHGQSNRYFNFIPDVTGTWHALSHYKNASGKTEDDDGVTSWESVEQKRAMYAEVIRWHHRQVAYFLERLRSVVEPNGGTLLDNSMIVYGASLGDGNEHDAEHLPTLLAGKGGGTIKTGRFLEHTQPTDLARVHLGLLQRMGLSIDTFGKADAPLDSLAG